MRFTENKRNCCGHGDRVLYLKVNSNGTLCVVLATTSNGNHHWYPFTFKNG